MQAGRNQNNVRPEKLTKPDSRFFIKDFVSATEAVLRCHQDPGFYIEYLLF